MTTSSIPKPPQRIRVEMPAEIAPQPVPEAVLSANTAAEEKPELAKKAISNKIHVTHPKKAEEEPKPVVQEAEIKTPALVTEVMNTSLDEKPVTEEVAVEMPVTTVTNIPSDEELSKRQYYTIGEVADMFGANQSQIRFWENEFEILQPKKNKKGDRYFRPEDIKNLVLIRHLLQERRFTIEGAKEYLKSKNKRLTDRHQAIQQLEKLKGFLQEMKANLGEQV